MSTLSPRPRNGIHWIGNLSFPSLELVKRGMAPWPECLMSIAGTTSDGISISMTPSSSLTSNDWLVQVTGLPNFWLLPSAIDGFFSPQLLEIIGWITSQSFSRTDTIGIVLNSSISTLSITLTRSFQRWIVTSVSANLFE